MIRASNRYGRFGVREIRDGSRRLGHPIAIEMAYKLGTEDFSLQLERLKEANVEAVVHWGDAGDGAQILNQMRDMGMNQPYFACDRCVSDEFLEIAGENAEGVICGYPWNPDRKDEKLDAFRAAFHERYGEQPETYASHAYRRHEHVDLGHPDRRAEPGQDSRRAGVSRCVVARRDRRHSAERCAG